MKWKGTAVHWLSKPRWKWGSQFDGWKWKWLTQLLTPYFQVWKAANIVLSSWLSLLIIIGNWISSFTSRSRISLIEFSIPFLKHRSFPLTPVSWFVYQSFLAPSGALIANPTYKWSTIPPTFFQITPVLDKGSFHLRFSGICPLRGGGTPLFR